MEAVTVTYSSKANYCKHANGWHKTIYFKTWFWTFKKRVFLCLDCEDIIEDLTPNTPPTKN